MFFRAKPTENKGRCMLCMFCRGEYPSPPSSTCYPQPQNIHQNIHQDLHRTLHQTYTLSSKYIIIKEREREEGGGKGLTPAKHT